MPRIPKKYENLEYKNPDLISRTYGHDELESFDRVLLFESLTNNTLVKHLDLSNITNITNALVAKLSDILKTNYTLTELVLPPKTSLRIQVYVTRNRAVADCLNIFSHYLNDEMVSFEDVHERIKKLLYIAPFLATEEHELPDTHYLIEAYRVLCSLSYLLGAQPVQALSLLQTPIQPPHLNPVVDKICAEALMAIPTTPENFEKHHTLLAYSARHNPTSVECATALATLSKMSLDPVSIEDVQQCLRHPKQLPNGATWLSYDEIFNIAWQAYEKIRYGRSPDKHFLRRVIDRPYYCPKTVHFLFKSDTFISALLQQYPDQTKFQCLEGFLELRYHEKLGGIYTVDQRRLFYNIDGQHLRDKPEERSVVQEELADMKRALIEELQDEHKIETHTVTQYTWPELRPQKNINKTLMNISVFNFGYLPDCEGEVDLTEYFGHNVADEVNTLIHHGLNTQQPDEATLTSLQEEIQKKVLAYQHLLESPEHPYQDPSDPRIDSYYHSIENNWRRLKSIVSQLKQGMALQDAVRVFEIEEIPEKHITQYKHISAYLNQERQFGNVVVYNQEDFVYLTIDEYMIQLRNRYYACSAPDKLQDKSELIKKPCFFELFPDLVPSADKFKSNGAILLNILNKSIAPHAAKSTMLNHCSELMGAMDDAWIDNSDNQIKLLMLIKAICYRHNFWAPIHFWEPESAEVFVRALEGDGKTAHPNQLTAERIPDITLSTEQLAMLTDKQADTRDIKQLVEEIYISDTSEPSRRYDG
ncbi:MAG: hypothetical protein P1U39_00285 [Legionellaceae bacterium]|nr:hypothetical protein [Legionellaceae bacterium]